MSAHADVTVVIPTMMQAARRPDLLRAIASLTLQEGGAPRVVVVANGSEINQALFDEVASLPHVDVIRVALGSLPNALKIGRGAVQTPFFAFLDDDDEYLPEALTVRKAALLASPEAAVAATQGYRRSEGRDQLAHEPPDPSSLLPSLAQSNWLASCGGLYRSALVQESDFKPEMAGLEWTYLAVRICLRQAAVYVPACTFRIHVTPGSASLNARYCLRVVGALEAILSMPLNAGMRLAFQKRLCSAQHSAAVLLASDGQWSAAWNAHFSSLRLPGGMRFALFTRHLLRGWLAGGFSGVKA